MKVKTAAESIVTIVAASLALILLNALVCGARARVDLTERQIFTLSPASGRIVKTLPEKMTVKAYFGGVAAEHADRQQYIENLLSEYAEASSGKLTWEKVPVQNDKKEQVEELAKEGVRAVAVPTMKDDAPSLGLVTFAVKFQYLDKTEVWSADPTFFRRPMEGMEYEFSTRMRRLTTPKKKVGVTTGFGEPEQVQALQHEQIGLGGLYEVVPVDWSQNAKDVETVDILVVNGPTTKVSDAAKWYLDQHLMKGKPALLLVRGLRWQPGGNPQMPAELQEPDQPFLGTPADHGLADILGHYGFEVGTDVVVDGRNGAPGIIPLGRDPLITNVFSPLSQTLENGHNQIFEGLEFVAMPFVSTVKATKTEGVEVKPLLRTVDTSFKQVNAMAVTRSLRIEPKKEDRGPFVVAYSFSGKLTSFFADKPRPAGVAAPDPAKPDEGAGDLMSAPPTGEALKESPPGTRLIVVGGSEFAEDKMFRVMQMLGTNVYLNGYRAAHNMVDWLSQDTELIAVRGKVVARPIEGLEKSTRVLVKAANVVGAPLALVVFGIVYWRVRERRRKNVRL
jgi:ABC-2 type transport system permease protein